MALNVFVGAYTASWGIWLLLPEPTFELPIYREFVRAHIPEPLLGAVMFGIGTLLLAATLAGSRLWRRRALLLHLAFWSFLSAFFFRGAPLAFSGPATVLFAAQSLWGFWIVGYQERRSRAGS